LPDGDMYQKLSKIKFLFLVVGQLLKTMIFYLLIQRKILFKKLLVSKNLNQEESPLFVLLAQILSSILDLMENISMINGLLT
jgi:hypothetical protein